jgi:phosphate transport system protein
MVEELRRSFHAELDDVKADIVRLGQSVIEAIPRATNVLLDSDLEGADYLIQADDELDARSIDLEERCFKLLALQQPMAGDLRGVVAALKLIGEIERSADLVANICKGSRRIYGHPLDPKIRGVVSRMAEQAQNLFSLAIDSYAESDVAVASALDDMDDMLDRLQVELIQTIFESHNAGRIDLQVAVQLAVVARFYERIGDHAVNIGDRVRYIVTGWLPEHAGAAKFRARHAEATAEAQVPQGS